MENILQAFSDIGEVLPRVDRLKATFGDNTHFNQAVGLIYSDLIEFHQPVYKFFRRKGWHFWFTFNWGLFERRFKSILHRLSSHCDLLDKEAAAIHFSEMKDFRDKRQREEEAFEQHRKSQMTDSVFWWLSGAEDHQEEQLHRISDDRQLEACNWVLEDAQMEAWIGDEGGDPVLWMTGIPGAGKTFCCSLVIQNLQTLSDQSCLYYFCGRQLAAGDSCALILRTLAIQLLQQNLDMVPLVHQAFLQKMSNRSAPALKKMLCQLLPSVKFTRLVVDGIDERDRNTQKEVIKSLLELQKHAGSNFKILISSREEPQIQTSLSPKLHLKLGDKTSQGLKLYVTEKVKDVQDRFPNMQPVLVERVAERLHGKAKGMFLWVRLVTAMLIQQISETELEQAVDELPDGLEEAYGRILFQINSLGSKYKDRVFNILFWLCTAYRPITIDEVADGIVLHTGQRELSKRTRSNNLRRDIVDLCAPLLEVSRTGVLDLVHFSAKEYLIDRQSGPFIDIARAHLSVALSCIINLTTSLDLIPRHDHVSDSDLESRVVKGTFGLQSYAHNYWAEHTASYFTRTADLDSECGSLISALQDFSLVCKHQLKGENVSSTVVRPECSFAAGLSKLERYPMLYKLVSGWLIFKLQLHETKPNVDTLSAQQECKLRTDETYLSLIDLRLSKMTEKILMMKRSELPSHIHIEDFDYFISRFKLPCRFSDCNHYFDSAQDRDTHELTHILSYPCLQCDFAGRGFRTRKELESHTQKYHMSPEDFEIPGNLYPNDSSNADELAPGIALLKLSRGWNERGCKVIQHGFSQVLAKVESRLATDEESVLGSSDKANIGNIRDKIKMQQYDSFLDFKDDLRRLVKAPDKSSTPIGSEEIGSFCDSEMEKAVSDYPVFANYDPAILKSQRRRTSFDGSDQTLEAQGSLNRNHEEDPSLREPLCTKRAPYWSLTEEKEFPELLRRCGRDFIKIADYLKTKTAMDVDGHFSDLIELGRKDLSEAADLADASLRAGLPSGEPTADIGGDDPKSLNFDASTKDSSVGLSTLPPNLDATGPYAAQSQGLASSSWTNPPAHAATKQSQPIPSTNRSTNELIKSKRKPPRKDHCRHCGRECHDEYAVQRHTLRFHTASRKVWICEDISIDKRFLSKCKSCLASKRYSSRNLAGSHLRQAHFNTETSSDTLCRWMRVIEEPNPNFQEPVSESTPQNRPAVKRQKTEVKPASLPPVLYDPSSSASTPLPSMGAETDQAELDAKALVALDGKQGDESPRPADLSINVSKSDEHDLLPDVSFDNVLPRSSDDVLPTYNDSSPHRANRTLIKPEQVPRLPHLNSNRKAVCQDQVDALYHKLDFLPAGGARYQEELENLTSLSRTLMSNLRDWRKHSNLAPDIPFSI